MASRCNAKIQDQHCDPSPHLSTQPNARKRYEPCEDLAISTQTYPCNSLQQDKETHAQQPHQEILFQQPILNAQIYAFREI